MSFLTSSSPCRSLNPPRAGRDRAYRWGHLWGVAGSGLEGSFDVLLRSRMGEHVLLLASKGNNSVIKKKHLFGQKVAEMVQVT